MNIEFMWFIGVVEDRLDPLKLGRCRVRILGKHTEEKTQIPTQDLPWAYPMQPITSAAMIGMGTSPTGLVEGTWVVGFFRDGADCQEPVIMGSLAGIPIEYPYPKSQTYGFLDPRPDITKRPRKIYLKSYPNDGKGMRKIEEDTTPGGGQSYPRRRHPYGAEESHDIIVGENDVNRLARNENVEKTIIGLKAKPHNRDLQIPIAGSDEVWDEPVTPYDATYPYNHVLSTESGHYVEFDDTRDCERIHVYHRTGTFIEIYPDGTVVTKIVGNEYNITMEERYDHVQNRYNLTVDGPINILCRNDAKIVVAGSAEVRAGGSAKIAAKGDVSLESETAIQFKAPAVTTSTPITTVPGLPNVGDTPEFVVRDYPRLLQNFAGVRETYSDDADGAPSPSPQT